MNTFRKTLFILLASVAMTGCRSAKPTAENYLGKEIVESTTDSSFIQGVDSLSVQSESECNEWETVRFVEGGGSVAVDAAGTIKILGVTTIQTSRSEKASAKMESLSSELQNQTKETGYSEMFSEVSMSKTEATRKHGISKTTAIIVTFIISFIIIIAFRIWRNLKK